MAKEDRKKGGSIFGAVRDGIGAISEVLSAILGTRIREGTEALIDRVEERVDMVSERLVRRLTTAMLTGIGVLLVIIAGVAFMIEYLGYSFTQSFVVSGVIIFIVSLLVKYYFLKDYVSRKEKS